MRIQTLTTPLIFQNYDLNRLLDGDGLHHRDGRTNKTTGTI